MYEKRCLLTDATEGMVSRKRRRGRRRIQVIHRIKKKVMWYERWI